jgi:hypothetical protein
MTRRWRWAVVAAGALVLLVLPMAVARLPVGRSGVSAPALLARIQRSSAVAFSGYAESSGGLSLPISTQLNSVNDLFGGTTQLRVWWRSAADWRVDAIDPVGENDLRHDSTGTWTWNYQANSATRTSEAEVPIVRLPRTADLVPATLARRLLSQASGAEVSRLPDARIAGRDAAGLRLYPSDAGSTIDRVDIWALPSSGLPVRVVVYGSGSSLPVLRSSMLDLSVSASSAAVTAFAPPPGSKVRSVESSDIVAAIDQFGNSRPPATLAGLRREPRLFLGAVGAYGRGITMLIALPLPPRLARSVASQLSSTAETQTGASRIMLGVGPVNLLLTPTSAEDTRWLLVGTVTPATLSTAAAELPPAEGFG